MYEPELISIKHITEISLNYIPINHTHQVEIISFCRDGETKFFCYEDDELSLNDEQMKTLINAVNDWNNAMEKIKNA